MRQSPFSYGSKPPRRMRSWILVAIIAGATLFVTVLAGLLDSNDDTSLEEYLPTEAPAVVTPTEVPPPEETQSSTSIPEPPADNSYAAIRAYQRTLSQSEWTTLARSLVDRQYQWTGTIQKVRSNQEIWVTMQAPADDAVPQVVLHLLEPAGPLTQGDQVSFNGTLARVVVMNQEVMLHFEDVQIVSAD